LDFHTQTTTQFLIDEEQLSSPPPPPPPPMTYNKKLESNSFFLSFKVDCYLLVVAVPGDLSTQKNSTTISKKKVCLAIHPTFPFFCLLLTHPTQNPHLTKSNPL
jgi:hypothetical protein